MSDWTSAGAQLQGLVDAGWRVELYQYKPALFVAEASGGGGWDDEIVGEGDTLTAAINDMAEKMLALADDEDADDG